MHCRKKDQGIKRLGFIGLASWYQWMEEQTETTWTKDSRWSPGILPEPLQGAPAAPAASYTASRSMALAGLL